MGDGSMMHVSLLHSHRPADAALYVRFGNVKLEIQMFHMFVRVVSYLLEEQAQVLVDLLRSEALDLLGEPAPSVAEKVCDVCITDRDRPDSIARSRDSPVWWRHIWTASATLRTRPITAARIFFAFLLLGRGWRLAEDGV
jgi:hypothetical protein